ncbi:MAG TPA: ATP-binding protein [Mycobacteriales bacterium]
MKALDETTTVPSDARAVMHARRFTSRLCARAGVDGDLCDNAVLLTSEVVTNAVIHGRSEARLRVVVDAERIRVEVGDDNSRYPVIQTPDEDALDGRGLRLLDVVATDWGVRDDKIGKTVWFEIRAASTD